MRGIRLLILAVAAVCIAVPLTDAAGCGALPSSVSALTLYCIPVNITNTQPSATSSGFQVMFNFNSLAYSSYISASADNIYVYNGISGAQMPTWIEGNVLNEVQTTGLNTANDLVMWVNLGGNTIASDASANGIYYIGIGATSTNFFLGNNGIGEAPQLSSSYGQYDNGATVFSYYCNFLGTSLGCGLSTVGSPTYAVSNGLTETSVSNSNFVAYATAFDATAYISDMLGWQSDTTGNDRFFSVVQTTSGTAAGEYYTGASATMAFYACTNPASTGSTPTGTTTNAVFSLWASSANCYGAYNYISNSLGSGGTTLTTAYYQLGGTNSQTNYYQWLRRRLVPPGSVMPTVEFGAIQSTSSSSLSIAINPVNYGISDLISSTPTPSSDSSNILYCYGTGCTPNIVLASGTNTISFSVCGSVPSISNCWTAGDWVVEGCDATAHSCSGTQTLVVNQISQSPACTFNGAQISSGSNTVSILASATLGCSISTLDSQTTGVLTYNGVNEGSGTATVNFGTLWDNKANPFSWNSPATANYLAGNFLGTITYVPSISTDIIAAGGNVYETSTHAFDYELNVSKAFTTANVALTQNNVVLAWNNQTVNAIAPQWFNFSYAIPLQAANDIIYTYNGDLRGTSPLVDYGTFNTVKQTTLWDYYVSGAWKHASIIEGGTQTLFANLTQPFAMQNAGVSNVIATIGSQTLHPLLLTTYQYYSKIASFTANAFGLTPPSGFGSVTIPANSLTFNLTFDGNSIVRAMTNTPTFTDSLGTLVPCNGIYTDVAFNYTFWNASQPSQQYTGNVQLNGYYQVVNGAYTSPVINGTSAGLSSTATSDQYETCETPASVIFPVSGGFSYQTSNSLISNYYLVQQASQPKNNIHLYLSSTLTNIAQYNIGVENVSTLAFIPALVQVKQYIPNTNSSVIIDEFKTSAGSGYVINLQQGTIYNFVAYTLNGQYLTTTPYIQAACATGQICSYVIRIGNSTSTLLSQIVGNMNYGCGYIYNATPNTTSVNCNFDSINGTSQKLTLDLWHNATASGITNATLSCTHTVTSASGSLSCTGTNTNTTSYFWKLFLNTTYGLYQLNQGSFGYVSAPLADIGWLILIIGIIAAGCLFVFINPALGVLGVVVVMAVLGLLGFYVESLVAAGAMIAFGAITAYTVYKKQRS